MLSADSKQTNKNPIVHVASIHIFMRIVDIWGGELCLKICHTDPAICCRRGGSHSDMKLPHVQAAPFT